MMRLLGGGLAIGFAALVVSIVIAEPGQAQKPPFPDGILLEASLSPDRVAPGEEITARPVQPCTPIEGEVGVVDWTIGTRIPGPGTGIEGSVPLDDRGGWEVTFNAPDRPGQYRFFAVCLPDGTMPSPDDGIPDDIEYYDVDFSVTEPASTTTTPTTGPAAPPARPAAPVGGQPTFTG